MPNFRAERVGFGEDRQMKFLGSILLLLSVLLFVAMPYGIGHGIAVNLGHGHGNKAIVIGLICGALGVGLFILQRVLNRGHEHSESAHH